MNVKGLRSVKDKATILPLDTPLTTNGDEASYYGFYEIVYDYENISEFPIKTAVGMRRYLPLLPVERLTLKMHEVRTPLFTLREGLFSKGKVYVKDESKNFTGSFKDKESIIVVNAALEKGIDHIYTVSSGNAAFSLSLFAKLNNIHATSFVATNTLKNKKELIELYGGNLSVMGDDYEDCYRKVLDLDPKGWNCCSSVNPYNQEGNKITAFEIYEDMGVPDKILVPCGNGTHLAGIYKGFAELMKVGLTNKIPQMIGVQIQGADPITRAVEQGNDYVVVSDPVDSIAESIVASESYSSPRVVKALEATQGKMINVDDKEIIEALQDILSEEGLLMEPTSASVFAALKKLNVEPHESVVCIVTGGGEKMIDKIQTLLKGARNE